MYRRPLPVDVLAAALDAMQPAQPAAAGVPRGRAVASVLATTTNGRLGRLANDHMLMIFIHLPAHEVFRARRVCALWRGVFLPNRSTIWRAVCERSRSCSVGVPLSGVSSVPVGLEFLADPAWVPSFSFSSPAASAPPSSSSSTSSSSPSASATTPSSPVYWYELARSHARAAARSPQALVRAEQRLRCLQEFGAFLKTDRVRSLLSSYSLTHTDLMTYVSRVACWSTHVNTSPDCPVTYDDDDDDDDECDGGDDARSSGTVKRASADDDAAFLLPAHWQFDDAESPAGRERRVFIHLDLADLQVAPPFRHGRHDLPSTALPPEGHLYWLRTRSSRHNALFVYLGPSHRLRNWTRAQRRHFHRTADAEAAEALGESSSCSTTSISPAAAAATATTTTTAAAAAARTKTTASHSASRHSASARTTSSPPVYFPLFDIVSLPCDRAVCEGAGFVRDLCSAWERHLRYLPHGAVSFAHFFGHPRPTNLFGGHDADTSCAQRPTDVETCWSVRQPRLFCSACDDYEYGSYFYDEAALREHVEQAAASGEPLSLPYWSCD